MTKLICLHRSFRQGGDLPPGRWCADCGAKIGERGSAVDRMLARKKREQRYAQQMSEVIATNARWWRDGK